MRFRWPAVAITALLSVAALRGAQAPATRAAATFGAPPGTAFYGVTPQFALSPSGQQAVFVASPPVEAPALWIQDFGTGTARRLTGTEQASYPFWSPDNRFVGFFASGKLQKIAADGGTAPIVLCDAANGRGGTWGAGLIVFGSGITDPLRSVPDAGGVPSAVTRVDTTRENSHRWPLFLPDHRHLLFWAGGGASPAGLRIASLDSPEVTVVGPADSNGAYADGYLFFDDHNVLVAQPFDAQTLRAHGEPIHVAEPLSADLGSSFASISASTAGTLLFTQGPPRAFVLTWFDRTGARIGVEPRPGQYTNVALGPCLAVSLADGTPANRDIWLLALAPGTIGRPSPLGAPSAADAGCPGRLTIDPAVDATPIWSHKSPAVIFSSQRAGPYQMYRKAGTTADELLLKSDVPTIATDWSSDDRHVLYTRTAKDTGPDVWTLTFEGEERTPHPFLATPAAEDNAVFSPDVHWVVYQSNQSGRNEVYARRFPPPDATQPNPPSAAPTIQVSHDGGTQPVWRADGKELFFFAPDGAVMAATTRLTATTFQADMPTKLFPAAVSLVIRRSYDVTPDGQRFLIPTLDDAHPPLVTIAPDWRALSRQ